MGYFSGVDEPEACVDVAVGVSGIGFGDRELDQTLNGSFSPRLIFRFGRVDHHHIDLAAIVFFCCDRVVWDLLWWGWGELGRELRWGYLGWETFRE